MLGFHCCTGFSLAEASEGYSAAAMRGRLLAVAPLVGEHGLQVSQASVVAASGL